MRTLSNYEATFLQSVHIKNVPCPSARDRQINLRLQSHVREQVRAKHVSHTACTPNCHGTVAHMHSHWLTLPHLSTHIKHPMNVQTFCYPHVSHNFTHTHTHSDVTFPFSKNTCSSVTTWGAEQADKSALHSNCLNRALHCCSFLWW